MKIDSISNFGYALCHPFSNKIQEPLISRIAIGILSTLLFFPMAYATISLLVDRITKKNGNNLDKTDKKTAEAGKILSPKEKEMCVVEVAKAFKEGETAIDTLFHNKGVMWVLNGLESVQPQNTEEIKRLLLVYAVLPSGEAEINTSIIQKRIEGIQRIKNYNIEGTYGYLRFLVANLKSPDVDANLITKKLLEFHEEMSRGRNREANTAWIGTCSMMVMTAYSFPELRLWALDQLISLQTAPEEYHETLLEWFGRVAASHEKELEKSSKGYIAIFKTIIEKTSDPAKRTALKNFFFPNMKRFVNNLCNNTSLTSFQCAKGLMQELRALEKNYPAETAPLINTLSTHTAFIEIDINSVLMG